jgi:archaellum biogenesis ATPase FlaH
MMRKIDQFCDGLNSFSETKTFTVNDLVNLFPSIGISTIRSTMSFSKKLGYLKIVKKVKKQEYYQRVLFLNSHLVRQSVNHASCCYRIDSFDQFLDKNCPAKVVITSSFYSTFAVLNANVPNIVACSGPNIDRFFNNIRKIVRTGAKIILAENDYESYQDIILRLQSLDTKNLTVNVRNCDVACVKDHATFYDLDCYGSWNGTLPMYLEKLYTQSQDKTNVIKGMIFSAFERPGGITKSNESVAEMLSLLGCQFSNTEFFGNNYIKQNGDWYWSRFYKTFPSITDFGRVVNFHVYRYAQKATPVITCLISYK